MDTITTIATAIIIICILAIIYSLYQLRRNERVYRIRTKWLYRGDARHDKYSYDEMFEPSPSNWWGLKWPREKQYR